MIRKFSILSLVMAGTIAMAHEKVANPTVQVRMHAMMRMADATKVMAQMAKNQTPFDAKAARAAAKVIEAHAKATPDLFRTPADDPKSEARPEIWQHYRDFTNRARALETAADSASRLKTPRDLDRALRKIGEACSACHKVYRE